VLDGLILQMPATVAPVHGTSITIPLVFSVRVGRSANIIIIHLNPLYQRFSRRIVHLMEIRRTSSDPLFSGFSHITPYCPQPFSAVPQFSFWTSR
jgi:hypothetical protein